MTTPPGVLLVYRKWMNPPVAVARGVLVSSLFLYFMGITIPIAEIHERIIIFTTGETVSLIGLISTLFSEREWFLGLLVVLFTIVTPLLKYIAIAVHFMRRDGRRRPGLVKVVEAVGKWSMTDVFILALSIVMVKLNHAGGILFSTSMTAEVGLLAFVMSIMTSIYLTSIMTTGEPEPGGDQAGIPGVDSDSNGN